MTNPIKPPFNHHFPIISPSYGAMTPRNVAWSVSPVSPTSDGEALCWLMQRVFRHIRTGIFWEIHRADNGETGMKGIDVWFHGDLTNTNGDLAKKNRDFMVISWECPWLMMWLKQGQVYHPWLGMVNIRVNIAPIKMVMTGGWFMKLF